MPQHINLSYLEMMADDDLSMKRLMLEMLLDELPKEINKMNVHYQCHEWDELRRVSHKMKTTVSFVGNKFLTKTNSSIGNIVKSQQQLEKLPDLFGILNDLCPKIVEEINAIYSECCSSLSQKG